MVKQYGEVTDAKDKVDVEYLRSKLRRSSETQIQELVAARSFISLQCKVRLLRRGAFVGRHKALRHPDREIEGTGGGSSRRRVCPTDRHANTKWQVTVRYLLGVREF